MEEAPFLRALVEQPTDETVRLVYADWLEERGDVRGEYLRLEYQLSLLPPGDPQAADKDVRLRELLVGMDSQWLGKAGLRFDLFLVSDVQGMVNAVLPRWFQWFRTFQRLGSLFTGRGPAGQWTRIKIRSQALWREADDLRGRLRGMLLSGQVDMPVTVVMLPADSQAADTTMDLGEILAQRPVRITEI